MRMGEGMSILVSYRPDGKARQENWEWLREYWKYEMPGAQVCVADDGGVPFSRAASLNLAFEQAQGDILWIADADFMMRGPALHATADLMRRNRAMGVKCWYYGSNALYRTKKKTRDKIIRSDPANPYHWSANVDDTHRTEAPASDLVLTRECFESVGGYDPRFRGWCGEEFAMTTVLRTLWGPGHRLGAPLIHLWHPVHGMGVIHRNWRSDHYTPKWAGQKKGGISEANQCLLDMYEAATHKPLQMKYLMSGRL